MNEKEFAEFVKLAAEKLKEESVYQILQNDTEYQNESHEEGVAEQHYLELDLTQQQRKVCNHLLDCRDRQNIDYSNCSYIAGVYDALRMITVLFPQKWDIEKVREIFSPK